MGNRGQVPPPPPHLLHFTGPGQMQHSLSLSHSAKWCSVYENQEWVPETSQRPSLHPGGEWLASMSTDGALSVSQCDARFCYFCLLRSSSHEHRQLRGVCVCWGEKGKDPQGGYAVSPPTGTQRGPSKAYSFCKLVFGKSYYGRMGARQDFAGFHSRNARHPSKWSSETHPGKRRAISTTAKADLPFLSTLSKLHCDCKSQNGTGRTFLRPILTHSCRGTCPAGP